jgi:hypothetical protein
LSIYDISSGGRKRRGRLLLSPCSNFATSFINKQNTMAMDIDDIIADLDHDFRNRDEEDLQVITRLWVAERGAPELMPWPESLVKRITNRISQQVSVPEQCTQAIGSNIRSR